MYQKERTKVKVRFSCMRHQMAWVAFSSHFAPAIVSTALLHSCFVAWQVHVGKIKQILYFLGRFSYPSRIQITQGLPVNLQETGRSFVPLSPSRQTWQRLGTLFTPTSWPTPHPGPFGLERTLPGLVHLTEKIYPMFSETHLCTRAKSARMTLW